MACVTSASPAARAGAIATALLVVLSYGVATAAAWKGVKYIEMNGHNVQLIHHFEDAWRSHVDLHHGGDDEIHQHPGHRAAFERSVRMVNERNANFLTGQAKYHLQLHRRSAIMSPYHSGLNPPSLDSLGLSSSRIYQSRWSTVMPYQSTDWRPKMPPVADQEDCQGCWAFAVTGAIEGAISAVRNMNATKLSDKQLLDCAPTPSGAHGCTGGWPPIGLDYASVFGLWPANMYNSTNTSCALSRTTTNAGRTYLAGYEAVIANSEWAQRQVLTKQPALAYINAQYEEFESYAGGIFDDEGCGTDVTHAVVVVGYGSENGTNFWILRNSWGPNWGEEGHMRIKRLGSGKLGICGITSLPWPYPIVSVANNPCIPNPCGNGTCTRTPAGGNNCTCPAGFAAVGSLFQICNPLDVCGNSSVPLCGDGTCLNDGRGGYTCTCPADQTIGRNAFDGSVTCARNLTQTVVVNATTATWDCNDWAKATNTFPEFFPLWNPWLPPSFGCNISFPSTARGTTLPVNQILKVPQNNPDCSVQYDIAYNRTADLSFFNITEEGVEPTPDSCADVASMFSMDLQDLMLLNLNQISPRSCNFSNLKFPTNTQICVGEGLTWYTYTCQLCWDLPSNNPARGKRWWPYGCTAEWRNGFGRTIGIRQVEKLMRWNPGYRGQWNRILPHDPVCLRPLWGPVGVSSIVWSANPQSRKILLPQRRSVLPPDYQPEDSTTAEALRLAEPVEWHLGLGDTCWSVWHNAGLTQREFLELNPFLDCQNLAVTQPVIVPRYALENLRNLAVVNGAKALPPRRYIREKLGTLEEAESSEEDESSDEVGE